MIYAVYVDLHSDCTLPAHCLHLFARSASCALLVTAITSHTRILRHRETGNSFGAADFSTSLYAHAALTMLKLWHPVPTRVQTGVQAIFVVTYTQIWHEYQQVTKQSARCRQFL